MKTTKKSPKERLMAGMSEKHDYLQALDSTSNAARDFRNDCTNLLSQHTPHIGNVPRKFLYNLAKLELNLEFLHETLLHDCHNEFIQELNDIVRITAAKEHIDVYDWPNEFIQHIDVED